MAFSIQPADVSGIACPTDEEKVTVRIQGVDLTKVKRDKFEIAA